MTLQPITVQAAPVAAPAPAPAAMPAAAPATAPAPALLDAPAEPMQATYLEVLRLFRDVSSDRDSMTAWLQGAGADPDDALGGSAHRGAGGASPSNLRDGGTSSWLLKLDEDLGVAAWPLAV